MHIFAQVALLDHMAYSVITQLLDTNTLFHSVLVQVFLQARCAAYYCKG